MADWDLLYVKLKTYLHRTKNKADNVAGFFGIARPTLASSNKDFLLVFVPERDLSSTVAATYNRIDMLSDSELESLLKDLHISPGTESGSRGRKPSVSCRVPASSLAHLFLVPLRSVYLVQFRTPSLGWWHGSVVVNTTTDEQVPIVFFHDNESPLTLRHQKLKLQQFDPFAANGAIYWGGHDFLRLLLAVVNTLQLSVEPSVYLVDPALADMANFSPFGEGNSRDGRKAPPKDAEPLVAVPDVGKFLASAKWRLLESVATLGVRTKGRLLEMVAQHVPQAVRQAVQPEVEKLADFESARVYLAKWAAQVKDEAELAQRRFLLEDAVYARINAELGDTRQLLTPQEASSANRRQPVSAVEWAGFFDTDGRLIVTVEEVKSRVFHGGLEPEVRPLAWPFLLGVYPWTLLEAEWQVAWRNLQSTYADFKRRWADSDARQADAFWKDQKVRIEKDVHRNDRNVGLYRGEGSEPSGEDTKDNGDDDEEDLLVIKNVHLYRLREILLTFNEYNVHLGYVQGMTDLLSPLYAVFQDEVMLFWAFAEFMARMERNFLRDQSGMKRQMLVLNELVQFMLPELYQHLQRCELTDLFFFFRMLLVWFKREFDWASVNTLWEVLWTDYYLSQFHLFVALAVLSDNERIMVQNLRRFDEVLKYMNDLLGRLKLRDLLVRAELLFLRFRRMVDLIDRDYAQEPSESRPKVNPDLRELLSRKLVIQKEGPRPEGAGGG